MTGQLFFVRKSWSLRYWTVADGKKTRRCVSLGTDDRTIAETRAARLLAGRAEMPSLFMEVQCFWSVGTEFSTAGLNFVCPGAFGWSYWQYVRTHT